MKSPNSHFVECGRKEAQLFHQNNQLFIDCLVKCPSVRHTVLLAYYPLVRTGQIVAIETMPEEEKEKLKFQTRYYADGRLNPADGVELSKALVTLEYFI